MSIYRHGIKMTINIINMILYNVCFCRFLVTFYKLRVINESLLKIKEQINQQIITGGPDNDFKFINSRAE
mgnify:CR=1 FL=1